MCRFLGPDDYTNKLGQMTNWTKWESVHFNSGQLLFNDVNWDLERHIIGERVRKGKLVCSAMINYFIIQFIRFEC